jgi:acyl-CoA synthetase (AMP-forming)/AMP-acid ligase II
MSAAPWALEAQTALHRWGGARPEHTALIDAQGPLTFRALLAVASRRARHLVSQQPGQVRVLPASPDRRFVAEVLATLLAGVAPLPVPAPAVVEVAADPDLKNVACHPWRAALTVLDGARRIVVSCGEPPTSARKPTALGLGPGTRALIASPLYLPGPFEYLLRQLLTGGAVILPGPLDPERWLTAANRHSATWAFVVPLMLSRLVDADPRRLAAAGTTLERLVYSSAPCPLDLRTKAAEIVGWRTLAEYYGTALFDGTIAEGTALMAAQVAGHVLPGTELRITDPATGRPVPTGQSGVIEGRSTAGLCTHLAEDPCPAGGQFASVGDRGAMTPDGRLMLTGVEVQGRAIVGGIKVAPSVLLQVLSCHPAVTDAAVRIEDDADYGQVLTAQVTTDDPSLNAEQISTWCAARLEPAARPRRLTLSWVTGPRPDPAGAP